MLYEVIAALLFIASAGLLFNERFRKNWVLVGIAGVVALASTYYLTKEIAEDIVDTRISERLPSERSKQGEADERKPEAPPTAAENSVQELEAWRSLGVNPTKQELEAFLKAFPDGKFSSIAKAKLKALEERSPTSSRPPTEATPAGAVAGGFKPGHTFRDCPYCPEMMVVPAGRFSMGSPPTEVGRDYTEQPMHEVVFGRNFAVGKFEVTFSEWEACILSGGCGGYRPDDSGWGRGARPVINVNWLDAQLFVAWMKRTTAKDYRLLTEAEWEYSARAGSHEPTYWGGHVILSCQYANVADRMVAERFSSMQTANCNDGQLGTALVGAYQPNAFGLYDLLGNVWEWVEDCNHYQYLGAPTDGSAWTDGDCSQRVLRGGSAISDIRWVRAAGRNPMTSTRRSNLHGFRVARTLER